MDETAASYWWRARLRRAVAEDGNGRFEHRRRRAAAAPRDVGAELLHENALVARELLGCQPIARLAVDEFGQSGVWRDEDRPARVFGKVADMFDHLLRPGGAVDADDIDDVDRFQRRQCAGDVRTEQHRPGRLDRDARDDRFAHACLLEGIANGSEGGLGLEEVLAGLDLEHVDPALDQAQRLLVVAVDELIPGDVA